MQSENQPQGAGSGEPAAPATGRECEHSFPVTHGFLYGNCRRCGMTPEEWRAKHEKAAEPPPSSPAREDVEGVKMTEVASNPPGLVEVAPVASGKAEDFDRLAGNPAFDFWKGEDEDVEPSGTASLRGAARLEEPERLLSLLWDARDAIMKAVTDEDGMDGVDATRLTKRLTAWIAEAERLETAQPSRSEAEGPSPSSPPSPASQGAEAGDEVASPSQNERWLLGSLESACRDRDTLRAKVETLEAALKSIAANSCCGDCQEAKRVAESALRAVERAPEAPALPSTYRYWVRKDCPGLTTMSDSCEPTDIERWIELFPKAAPSAAGPLRDAKRVEEPGAAASALIREFRASYMEGYRDGRHDKEGASPKGSTWEDAWDGSDTKYNAASVALRLLAPPAESSPPLPAGEGSRSESSPVPPAGPAVDLEAAPSWLLHRIGRAVHAWRQYEMGNYTAKQALDYQHECRVAMKDLQDGFDRLRSPGGAAHG